MAARPDFGPRPVKRLAWLSDVHLGFLEPRAMKKFVGSVLYENPDAVAITGDIADALTVRPFLVMLAEWLARPIYFVLGNHDYYGGSIPLVRGAVEELCEHVEHLHWMPQTGIVALSERTALIGHGGWADARCGDYEHSEAGLNDFYHIKELTGLDRPARLQVMRRLADGSAGVLAEQLRRAVDTFEHVIALTHVPPFGGAAWHEGKVSDDEYLPFYASRVAGEALMEVMAGRDDRRLTVLCGHTHSGGTIQPAPNVTVHTAAAEYGRPRVEQVIDV